MGRFRRGRKLRASRRVSRLMAEHHYELNEAAAGRSRPVAWCSSVGPVELLRAMGFAVHFPENHAALLGTSQQSASAIQAASSAGISADACSYTAADIGAHLMDSTPLSAFHVGNERYRPIERVAAPDVLVASTNQCVEIRRWFDFYSRRLGVPLLTLDGFVEVDQVTDGHVAFIAGQLRELAERLQQVQGALPAEEERLAEVVGLSRLCSDLWASCLETAAAAGSPWTFFDQLVAMGPAVVARGTEQAVSCYEELLDELESRRSEGFARVDPEKHRLYWEGMPIWPALRELESTFQALDIAVVASTYCGSWVFDALDADRPWESMARAYTELFVCRSERIKGMRIASELDKYRCDGILWHDSRTCPANTNCRFGLQRRVTEDSGVPHLVLEADHTDPEQYSTTRNAERIEAFAEQLDVVAEKNTPRR
ncbi:MAG: 2-hydroxyacyl-CoA dehydratase family protein [Polyangia bacterium]